MAEVFNIHTSISGYEFQNVSRKAFELGEKIENIEWDIAALDAEVTIDPEEMKNTAVGALKAEYWRKEDRAYTKFKVLTIILTVLLCGAACTVLSFLLTPFFALTYLAIPLSIILMQVGVKICKFLLDCFLGMELENSALIWLVEGIFAFGSYYLLFMFAANGDERNAIIIACISVGLDLFSFLFPFLSFKIWERINSGKFKNDPTYQRRLQEAEQQDQATYDKELQARKEARELERKQKLPALNEELATLRAEFAYYKPVLELWEERMDELRRYECPLIPASKEDFFNQLVRETPGETTMPLILSYHAKDKFQEKKEECQKDINDCMGLLDDIFNMVKEDPSRLNKLR